MKFIVLLTFLFWAAQAMALSQAEGDQVRDKKMRVHYVEKGDQIMTISFKYYGTHQKWRYIMTANPNINPSALEIGQKVFIPYLGETKPGVVSHKAKPVPKPVKRNFNSKPITVKVPKLKKEIVIATVPTPRAELAEKNYETVSREPADINEDEFIDVDLDDVSDEELDAITDEVLAEDETGFIEEKKPVIVKKKPVIKPVFIRKRAPAASPKPMPLPEDKEQLKSWTHEREPAGKFDPWSTGSKVRDDEERRKIAEKAERLQKEKGSLLEEYKKLQQKFRALERKHLKVVSQKQKMEEKIYEYQYKDRKFARWQSEKQELESHVTELKKQLENSDHQKNIIAKKSPVYLPSMLSYSQEQVLREKNRILAQRFWIEKNRPAGKCAIQLQTPDESQEVRMTEFVNFLNERLGSHQVFVDPTENKVTFQLPGKTVYGVEDPKMRQEYRKLLSQTSDLMHGLPIDNINITGFTKYSQVNLEKGGKVSGEFFSLNQSETIKDFFVNEQGWSPKHFTSGTYGHNLQSPMQKSKRFDVEITFKKNVDNFRKVASVTEADRVLENISDEILTKLQEPKYAKVDVNPTNLAIHLGRHYFISSSSWKLTPEGQQKIDSVMGMFALVNDANFELEWVPGVLEEDGGVDRKRAMYGIQKLKAYIFEKYPWAKGRLKLTYGNKHNKLKAAFTSSADRWNRRLVFKVLPTSIHTREFKEPVLEVKKDDDSFDPYAMN